MDKNSCFILGVCGASGSGKTSFVNQLVSYIGEDNVSLHTLDNYYKPIEFQQKDANGKENFDLPSAIDIEKFHSDLKDLIAGKIVIKEEYTFNNPNVIPNIFTIYPKKIIIVEGVFIFHYPEINKLFDLKLFIQTSDYLCVLRRLQRDLITRNYSFEHTLYDFENHVIDGYEQFIKPYIKTCDLIINNEQNMTKPIQVIAGFLKSIF